MHLETVCNIVCSLGACVSMFQLPCLQPVRYKDNLYFSTYGCLLKLDFLIRIVFKDLRHSIVKGIIFCDIDGVSELLLFSSPLLDFICLSMALLKAVQRSFIKDP